MRERGNNEDQSSITSL